MADIDDRVVSMSFESAKFIQGISTSLSSLDKLNAALKKVGVDNGLDNIEKSANKIHFGGLGTAIDKIKAKFGRGFPEADQAFSEVEKGAGKVSFNPISSAIDKIKSKFHFPEADNAFAGIERASGKVTFSGLGRALDGLTHQFGILQGAAAVALGNISAQFIQAQGRFVKGLSIAPIIGGFQEYQTQIGAIQTILANTKASGATLKDVGAALNDLNHYADKTIYNFTEMTRNIGTFTAAGVDLDTATASIKGIANLAALSGSNSQQASTAMYQLSQAISSGRVALQDWNSVVNAGMGGTVFQRALAQTAVAMGKIDENSLKLSGRMKNVKIDGESFRNSIMAKPGEESWLTSDVLTNTLKQFSGDLSDAELKAQGFNKAQIKAIRATAKMAVNSATQVKTLSALIDTTKEAIGSGWAQTWQIVFGDFGEAKHLFTDLSNAIGGMVGASSKARNSLLKDWKELGGRKVLIDGLKNAFQALSYILQPIKLAFRDIFPKHTAKDLYDLTVRFRDFMESLKIGPETAFHLRQTFAGFFALLDIGKTIISGIFTAISHLFGTVENGSGGILKLTGNLGDLIVGFDAWLKQGDKVQKFFGKLGDILGKPLELIQKLAGKLNDLFSGDVGGGLSKSLSDMGQSLKPAEKAAQVAQRAWDGFLDILDKVKDTLGPVLSAIGGAFADVGDYISDAFTNLDWDKVFSGAQVAITGGIFLVLKKALGSGLNLDIGGGVLKNLSGSLDVLRNSLVDIQRNIQAHTLQTIATAVGILAASVVAFSLINPKKLETAMTAVAVGMGELVGAMALLAKATKGAGPGGVATIVAVSGSMILLSSALLILTPAVLILSTMDWGSLVKGLAGVLGLFASMAAVAPQLSKSAPGIIAAGIGFLGISTSLVILSGAVKIFSTMEWEGIAKGLLAVDFALVAIARAVKGMPLGLPLIGGGLILVGIGLSAVAGAIKLMGSMDLATLGKGLLSIAVALEIFDIILTPMTKNMIAIGAGLILVGLGLSAVGAAVSIMGQQDVGTLAKGMIAIGAALRVLALGLFKMSGSLLGAAALTAAAFGLGLLAPTLILLGHVKFSTIAKGLGAIALTLGVIGTAGVLAGPAFVVLGAGLAALGLGVAGVGAGVYLLGKGVALLATNGSKGIAVFVAAMTAFILAIPKLIISFLKGLVDILEGIATLAPKVVEATVKIGAAMLDGIIRLSPKMAEAALALITSVIKILDDNAGPILAAGFRMLQTLLEGVARSIPKIVPVVARIVVRFLNSLSSHIGKIINAGANFVVKFLNGIANNAGRVVAAGATMIAKFLVGVANNIGKVITAGAKILVKFLEGIGNNIGKVVTAGANAVVKFIAGIGNNLGKIATAGVNFAKKFVDAIVKGLLGLVDAAAQGIINFLNGIAEAIRTYGPELVQAGANIAAAIIEGLIKGLASIPGVLADHLLGPVKDAVNAAGDVLDDIGGFLGLSTPFVSLLSDTSRALVAWANGTFGPLPQMVAAIFYSQAAANSRQMRAAGTFLLNGFRDGLLGTGQEINNAVSSLGSQLTSAYSEAASNIKEQQAKIDKLRKEKHKDTYGPLANAIKLKAENERVKKIARDGYSELTGYLKTGKSELLILAKAYDDVSKKLTTAKAVLAEATRARDDAFKSFADQFAALPSIADAVDEDGKSVDQLKLYTESLTNQVAAVKSYKETLAKLQALGLDAKTFQKLMEDGTIDQKFADQIVAGGPEAIKSLKTLNEQLATESGGLASSSSLYLYQAGVTAAQKVVDGLIHGATDVKGLDQIKSAMDEIANVMIKQLKKKLKISSPSEVFAQMGKYSSMGMAKGLRASSNVVTAAVSDMSDDALVAMRNNMSRISDALSDNIEMDPTITPILDLSVIERDAKKLAGITDMSPVTSYGRAMSISTEQVALSEDVSDILEAGVKFEQNNYSPKALSATEIYRQTNNQLSQAKKALGK